MDGFEVQILIVRTENSTMGVAAIGGRTRIYVPLEDTIEDEDLPFFAWLRTNTFLEVLGILE